MIFRTSCNRLPHFLPNFLPSLPFACYLQVDPNGFRAGIGGANKLNAKDKVTYAAGWGVETVLTFIFALVIFACTNAQRAAGTDGMQV
jgi:hypothetical protein